MLGFIGLLFVPIWIVNLMEHSVTKLYEIPLVSLVHSILYAPLYKTGHVPDFFCMILSGGVGWS